MPRELPQKDYDPSAYAVVALFRNGYDSPSLLSDEKNRVVVFDNKLVAQDWIPSLIAPDRLVSWSEDGEYAYFSPIDPNKGGINRVAILHPYDLYNLPPNHPVLSETRHRAWKRHVIVSQWIREWEEGQEKKPDPYEMVRQQIARSLASP